MDRALSEALTSLINLVWLLIMFKVVAEAVRIGMSIYSTFASHSALETLNRILNERQQDGLLDKNKAN